MKRIAILAAAVAVGCKGPKDTQTGDTTRPARDSARATGSLTDAQIVVLASQLDGSEISAAQGALAKLGDRNVRAFAEQMKAEHAAMDSTLNVGSPVKKEQAAQPPAQFATMQAASSATAATLMTMPSGGAYDRFYVASQVTAHATALDSLTLWSQAARDGELQKILQEAIGRVKIHLERARALQQALGGAADDTVSAPPPDTSLQTLEARAGNVEKSRVTDTTSTTPNRSPVAPTPSPKGVRPNDAAPITPRAPKQFPGGTKKP